MLSNVTNPKIVLFFFAFLPQFVDPASAHPTRDLVFLGVLYAAARAAGEGAVGVAAGSLVRARAAAPRGCRLDQPRERRGAGRARAQDRAVGSDVRRADLRLSSR